MDMKKYCQRLKRMDPPLLDVPVVYLPCPNKQYKAKVVNRAMLSHAQYMNLLATPKGFTWSKDTGLASPPRKRRLIQKDDEMAPKSPLRVTDYRFINDYIKDTWKVMTPEYEKRLENILMSECGMTESKAKEFLEEQKLRSTFSNYKPMSRFNLSPRHEWVKEVADILAGKLTDCFVGMLTVRRTKRVRFLTEAILNGFGELTGEKSTLGAEPQNTVQGMQLFAADRLALWMSKILGHCDEELCRKIIKVQDKKALGGHEDESETEESDEDAQSSTQETIKDNPENDRSANYNSSKNLPNESKPPDEEKAKSSSVG